MADCYGIWEQGYEINRVVEWGSKVPQFRLQSELHMAHVNIEIGRLTIADRWLDACDRTNTEVSDPDYRYRVLGYRALVTHLRGDLLRATRLYKDATDGLEEPGTNLRASAKFYDHWAALELARKDVGAAEGYWRTSRAKAASGQHADLYARSQLTEGSIERARDRLEPAMLALTAALAQARALHMRGLEAEVLSEMARVGLQLGDAESARQRACAALTLANELHLGLRQTHSLLLLGRANLACGLRDLGLACLRLAAEMGERQHYFLRMHQADQLLEQQGAGRRKAAGDAAPGRVGGGDGPAGAPSWPSTEWR